MLQTKRKKKVDCGTHSFKRGEFADLTGMTFGRLTVVKRIENRKDRASMWLCRCSCGNMSTVKGYHLRCGATLSCGCLHHNMPYTDLTGMRRGHFIVLKEVDRPQGKQWRHFWLCRCDCGTERIYETSQLNRIGRINGSCGCEHKKIMSEMMRKKKTTHGCTKTRLYAVWSSMKNRCLLKSCKEYPLYGGRGITICDEWASDFQAFQKWALQNGYDKDAKRGKCTLDRIDVNGNYCPENCRWVDQKTQSLNRRDTIYLECNGKKKTIPEWSEISGIPQKTIRDRLKYGWPIEDVIFKKRRIWNSEQ